MAIGWVEWKIRLGISGGSRPTRKTCRRKRSKSVQRRRVIRRSDCDGSSVDCVLATGTLDFCRLKSFSARYSRDPDEEQQSRDRRDGGEQEERRPAEPPRSDRLN